MRSTKKPAAAEPTADEQAHTEREAPVVEEITLDAFLSRVRSSETLKVMFARHLQVTGGKQVRTEDAFEKAFNAFRKMPAASLK